MRMSPAQQKEWKAACKQELDSLCARDVYDIVDPPPGRKIIKNRWVFDVKSDGRKKACLVAKGFSQVEGIDFDDIFSPVVRFETVRLMLTLAALENWHMLGIDVKTAFLYGELDEELYMEQPEGFKIKGQERKVLRLKRAIYGLKQAALQWWRTLDKSMHKLGFKHLLSNSGLFVIKNKRGEPEVIVIIYVDNAVFMGPNKSIVSKARDRFMNDSVLFFCSTSEEKLTSCRTLAKSLSHEITVSCDNSDIQYYQPKMIALKCEYYDNEKTAVATNK